MDSDHEQRENTSSEVHVSQDNEKKLEISIEKNRERIVKLGNEVLNHFKYAIAAYLKAHFRHGGAVSEEIDQKDLGRHRQIAWAIAAGKVKSAYSLTVEMLDSNHSHFSGDE